ARPKLLLLDEPSMGLAPMMVSRIFELVREIAAEGVTMLLVEQNARRALEISHRGYVMESGAISLAGASAELLDNARVREVYLSTSGVYGDCRGERVAEDRPVKPMTSRARRRLDAERQLEDWCSRHRAALVILRVPGIYAAERLPLERLRARLPVLRAEDDV